MLPKGDTPALQAYRWMVLAMLSLGIGAFVAYAKAGHLPPEDDHRRLIRTTVVQAGGLFLLGLLLTPTPAGLFVQAAAIAWYLYRYARGSVLAETEVLLS